MMYYIWNEKKIIFIVPPKCGNTTIASHLKLDILHKYSLAELEAVFQNATYTVVFVVRKNVIDRFLSGLYEDLLTNSCYDNLNMSFTEYLAFLHHCHAEKIPNVNNINVYNPEINHEVYFGSKNRCPITNANGQFISHVQLQSSLFDNILTWCENIKLLQIEQIDELFHATTRLNVKEKKIVDVDLDSISLAAMKAGNIIINESCLQDKHKNMILSICEKDVDLIEKLFTKYEKLL